MTSINRRKLFEVGAIGVSASFIDDEPLFKGNASAAQVSFLHGVASGDPGSDSIVLWTRVTTEEIGLISVQWFVYDDFDAQAIVQKGVFWTGAARDHTVKIVSHGLSPSREYYYNFKVNDENSPTGRFKTLPEGSTEKFRIIVASCANFQNGFFNAYREISRQQDVDLLVHLGDYFYEYGPDGYGGAVGRRLGRVHEPPHELVTLSDYRTRHSQYKSEVELQEAHAAFAWICSWDDHEISNNAFQNGAQNHQPETEGRWIDRKAAAIQAYLEWMPVRDPELGRPREALYRRFDIGDLATLFMLETRLTGRSESLDYSAVAQALTEDQPAALASVMEKILDPERTMLGAIQEQWLWDGLKNSVESGAKWQIVGTQVLLADVRTPNVTNVLTQSELDALPNYLSGIKMASRGLSVPMNLDAWNGYPVARERLYQTAQSLGARIVSIAGDSHSAWANELRDSDGQGIGLEFACTTLSALTLGAAIGIAEIDDLITDDNDNVKWNNSFRNGFSLLEFGKDRIIANYLSVSNVSSINYKVELDASFQSYLVDGKIGPIFKL